MLLSMTGFGKAVAELPSKKISVEVKSLNSKQLDLSMRVPAVLRDKEIEMRAAAAHKLERGKVEINIYIDSQSAEQAMTLNLPLIQAYKKQIDELGAQLGIPAPTDWYTLLLRFPDTVKAVVADHADDTEYEAALDAMHRAIEALTQHRAAEGARLYDFFTERIHRISEMLAQVPRYEVERVEKIRSRMADNLASIPQVDYDRGRLEQELIFYIEKLDVNEERQRLGQHLRYFLETLDCEPGQGKKLGFIAQEMGREINTLGSKSNHAEMQRIVVKMKDELEQIKEQVLNVL
ncbi:MAG: YicC family protein [Muribaculaceae bacterium]|nr:YicC family protein [Muribaculaceae bacterium]